MIPGVFLLLGHELAVIKLMVLPLEHSCTPPPKTHMIHGRIGSRMGKHLGVDPAGSDPATKSLPNKRAGFKCACYVAQFNQGLMVSIHNGILCSHEEE
jgi:hypothetical protein